ncbi:hypothetical protein KY362_06795 [Candidatus Woesearchaeota archaeon]|nr:hypothetical protein [Candidatus Woesearchaeota archaeon]
MARKVSLGSAKRYGPRYGKRNKEKVSSLEKQHRERQKCPFCNYVKVRRLSPGIWLCEKCDAKFASKAYSLAPKKKVKEVAVKEELPLDLEDETTEEVPEEDYEEDGTEDEAAQEESEDSDVPEELLNTAEEEDKQEGTA